MEYLVTMKLYAAPLDFRAVAEEFSVPTDFSSQVHDAARTATDYYADSRIDARDLPLVTIDPPGSMDLDQAVYIEQGDGGQGYRVYYAIADVAAWVNPDGVIADESIRRGQTIYLPDEPARLHPPELSEDSASLLPDVDRPAVLWTFELNSAGEVDSFDLKRALVRSHARLDYDGVHEDLVNGRMHSSIALLPQVGKLRQESSLRREAISLRVPSQRVAETEDGNFELVIEPRHEVMDYNSEISLLTGMCAGRLMQEHGVGFLRTLPPASPESEAEFRAEIAALGFDIGKQTIPEFLMSINADSPRGMAVMREAMHLLRGAGYIRIGKDSPAEVHAGIGGYYAHVTAPLRRLVDRYATEVCLALAAGREVPEWVFARGDEVVDSMRSTSQLASQVEKACLNLTEATVLSPWIDSNFEAVILSAVPDKKRARAFVAQPPVIADVVGAPEQGEQTTLSLITADPAKREVAFAWPAD